MKWRMKYPYRLQLPGRFIDDCSIRLVNYAMTKTANEITREDILKVNSNESSSMIHFISSHVDCFGTKSIGKKSDWIFSKPVYGSKLDQKGGSLLELLCKSLLCSFLISFQT